MIFQTTLYAIPAVVFYDILNDNNDVTINASQLSQDINQPGYQNTQIV